MDTSWRYQKSTKVQQARNRKELQHMPNRSQRFPAIEVFLRVEDLGLANKERLLKDDKYILKNFVESTVKNNGRNEVDLPWRSKCSQLKDNRDVVLKRLESQDYG
ncbi:hypothetical protein HPB49_003829 [Dermacentor silvarum]|uniref:Uncharacterized protein n=1 Tax=Dermacentor silvarum TaxID=543639 RepID=A0ACB8DTE0_DERSI|nr:hypothetical protein HPB49_003829 [Dermacentor silvarum]